MLDDIYMLTQDHKGICNGQCCKVISEILYSQNHYISLQDVRLYNLY